MTAGRILIVEDDVRLAGMLLEEFWCLLHFGGRKDGILALELRADNPVKPFSAREFVARLCAILRRSAKGRSDSTPLAFGALTIDPGAMSATFD